MHEDLPSLKTVNQQTPFCFIWPFLVCTFSGLRRQKPFFNSFLGVKLIYRGIEGRDANEGVNYLRGQAAPLIRFDSIHAAYDSTCSILGQR